MSNPRLALRTFNGESHVIALCVGGPDSHDLTNLVCVGLENREFRTPGVIVADITVAGTPAWPPASQSKR